MSKPKIETVDLPTGKLILTPEKVKRTNSFSEVKKLTKKHGHFFTIVESGKTYDIYKMKEKFVPHPGRK